MMTEIANPVAIASVRWLTAAEGGRSSGPPVVPVYASTAAFVLGGDGEVQSGWPATADPMLSILIQIPSQISSETSSGTSSETGYEMAGVRLGFLAPEIAAPYMHDGAELVILEGPKVVGHAVVTSLV